MLRITTDHYVLFTHTAVGKDLSRISQGSRGQLNYFFHHKVKPFDFSFLKFVTAMIIGKKDFVSSDLVSNHTRD